MKEENKNNKQYNLSDIQRYVEGKMSAQQMHDMEKAALDDPFLADAMEGLENRIKDQGSAAVQADLGELHRKLTIRINQDKKTRIVFFNHWWQVAAGLIVLLGTGLLMYTFLVSGNRQNRNIAQTQENKAGIDTASVHIDSIKVKTLPQAIAAPPPVALHQNPNLLVAKQFNKPHKKRASSGKIKNVVPIPEGEGQTASASRVHSNALSAGEKKGDSLDTIGQLRNSVAKNIDMKLEAAQGNNFIGKVVDFNSRPVMGATVMTSNPQDVTTTDNRGIFTLYSHRPDSTVKITINSEGFASVKAILSDDKDIENNTINLRNKTSSLSEVMASGLNAKKKMAARNIATDQTMKNAEPVIGWKKYKEYLDKNKRLSGDSLGLKIIEVLSFTIKKNGKLSNFIIEQSYDDNFDDEAIRLIKNGPPWKVLKNEKTRATLTIEF